MAALLDQREAPGGRTIQMPWDARELIFSVREAFPSKWTQTGLVFGKVKGDEPLVIESENAEGGVIFSDGMQHDALEFNAPLRAEIGLAAVAGRIGWPEKKGR